MKTRTGNTIKKKLVKKSQGPYILQGIPKLQKYVIEIAKKQATTQNKKRNNSKCQRLAKSDNKLMRCPRCLVSGRNKTQCMRTVDKPEKQQEKHSRKKSHQEIMIQRDG